MIVIKSKGPLAAYLLLRQFRFHPFHPFQFNLVVAQCITMVTSYQIDNYNFRSDPQIFFSVLPELLQLFKNSGELLEVDLIILDRMLKGPRPL